MEILVNNKPYGAKTELWYLDMYLVQNNPFLIYFSTFLKPNLDLHKLNTCGMVGRFEPLRYIM